MNSVVAQIEHDKLILTQSGLRMVLNATQALQLLEALQLQVPQIQSVYLQKLQENAVIISLFEQGRDQVKNTDLQQGIAILNKENVSISMLNVEMLDVILHFFVVDELGQLQWIGHQELLPIWQVENLIQILTDCASAIITQEDFFKLTNEEKVLLNQKMGVWWQLWHMGAFDHLLKKDCSNHLAGNWILKQRILYLSHVMQWMDANTFWMGDDSLDAWDFEQPVHQVTLSSGIWIGRYPVTQQLYQALMHKLPTVQSSESLGAFHPVVGVTWFEAIEFCNRLSIQEGRSPFYQISENQEVHFLNNNGYRLLTEAEWECAARGGQQFSFAGSSEIQMVGWTIQDNCEKMPTIGQKMANALDLFDMSGLVWEWCQDWYDAEYYHSSQKIDPLGPNEGEMRVCRGGSYLADPDNARVSLRGRLDPMQTWSGIGFRICCFD